MTSKLRLLSSTAAALLLLTQAARASDLPSKVAVPIAPTFAALPAVDGINGKVEAAGGWSDQQRFGILRRNNLLGEVRGALSVPLGQSFGLQVDGMLGSHNGGTVSSGGAHLFWRDPSRALVGVYGSASHNSRFGGRTYFRVGPEVSLYLDRFTISGIAGYEWTNSAAAFGAITFGDRGRFFDMVDISYYPTDNIKFSVGHRYVGGRHAAALGAEALLSNQGGVAVAAFVDGRLGERDYKAVMGGIRVYFGQKEKTLIRRHREDDPTIWLEDEKFSAGNNAKKGVTAGPAPACPPGFTLTVCGCRDLT
ncbi:MAG: hypothetical protein MUC44_07070 [Beijerinckiaceae bacterium]|nr:hypothetical protein [Beijerinckiaceae bacterium]